MNPYEPTAPVPQPSAAEPHSTSVVIKSTLVFSAKHLVETLERYRSQSLGREIWKWFRWIISAIMLLVGLIELLGGTYVLAVILIGLSLFLFFRHKIDNFFAVRGLRKSPHFNVQQTMEFSNEGLHSISDSHDSKLAWSAFSNATFFRDGVLIFRGPKMIHWIPDSSLSDAADATSLRNLVASRLESKVAN